MSTQESYILVTGKIDPAEEGGYVSTCPELGIASQGETVEEATENLSDAIDVLITSLREDGVLENVLRDRGIEILTNAHPSEEPKTVSVTPGEFVSALVAMIGVGRVPV